MKLTTRQTYKLKQIPKINHVLLNSLKILELNTFDFLKTIQETIETNPLLINKTVDMEAVSIKNTNLILNDLLMQLHTSDINQKIGEYIIRSLNNHGYFTVDIDTAIKDVSCNKNEFLKTLHCIQTFEPKGIASRNLYEYLTIQAKENNDNLLVASINYLEQFSKGHFQVVAKNLNISINEARLLFKKIQSLKPYPAILNEEGDYYLIPDFEVYLKNDNISFKLKNFDYLIETDDSIEPVDKESEDYIKNKLKEIKHLKRSIILRNNTLKKIIKVILHKQKMFFVNNTVNPLTLKDISSATNYHISTIHRALKNKSFIFNDVIYDIHILLSNKSSAKLSKHELTKLIKKIILEEDKKEPLSDQDISLILKENNLLVSRRTVAKYRTELKILSSSKRKIV